MVRINSAWVEKPSKMEVTGADTEEKTEAVLSWGGEVKGKRECDFGLFFSNGEVFFLLTYPFIGDPDSYVLASYPLEQINREITSFLVDLFGEI